MTNPLLIDLIPALETPRLQLRMPAEGDGVLFHEALSETLPALRRFLSFLPWVAAEPSVEASEVFCRRALAAFHARTDFPYLMIDRARSRLVGVCGLHRPDWTVPRFELGYWCRTSDAGRGFVTEAVGALSQAAIDRYGAARLEAITDEDNIASRRVAERCGFVLEGVLRATRRDASGGLRNACVYARVPAASGAAAGAPPSSA